MPLIRPLGALSTAPVAAPDVILAEVGGVENRCDISELSPLMGVNGCGDWCVFDDDQGKVCDKDHGTGERRSPLHTQINQ